MSTASAAPATTDRPTDQPPANQPPPDQPPPDRNPQPPPQRHRRIAAVAVLLTVVASATAALWTAQPMDHGPAVTIDDPASLRGSYRTGPDDHLTVVATDHAISYERAGTEVVLRPAGVDRYHAADDPEETLTFRRDADGTVTGVVLHQPGAPAVTALRDHGYVERDITFPSGEVQLAGTLLLPTSPGPHPGVVWVHGAGPADRSQFQLRAAHLARAGIATLFYDKRGVGGSTGNYDTAGFDDLAVDATAAIDVLAAQPEVDADRVGVAGFSQGAWVAAIVARHAPQVAFVIAFSGSGFSPADANAWLHGNLLAVRGLGRPAHHAADRFLRMLYTSLDLVEAGVMDPIPHVPGFWFHALDPHLDSRLLWRDVQQPVLAIWGAQDCQVPAHDSAEVLADVLSRTGNDQVTLRVVAGADHGLRDLGPCRAELGRHRLRWAHPDDVLAAPAAWIHQLPDAATDGTGAAPVPHDRAPLDWHQPPPAPAPWHGSLLPQLALKAVLVLVFAGIAVTTALRRWRRTPGHPSGGWVGPIAVTGVAAVFIGTVALIEIYMLGGMHAAMLLPGPAIAGRTPLLLLTEVLVAITFVGAGAHGIAALRRSRHRRATDRMRMLLLLTTVGLGLWAAYWGVLPG